MENVTHTAALLAGILSFFSPCVLPLVPGYFTFLTGLSLEDLTRGDTAGMRRRLVTASAAFVVGFSLVFVLMGASASFLGTLMERYQTGIRIAGGVVIVLLGIHISGIYRLGVLDVEKRLHLARRPAHLFGTFLVGMAFGAGWTPCIGPLLGAILIMAGSTETVTQGVWLLAVYSLGLAAPFVALAFFAHSLLSLLKRAGRLMVYMNRVAGGLLIAVGVLLVTDRLRFL